MHNQEVSKQDNIMIQRLFTAALRVVRDMRMRVEATSEPPETLARCLLYLMIQAEMSDEEMAGTFVNVMVAAGEAPASALAQTLEELSMNQPVLERLVAEAN